MFDGTAFAIYCSIAERVNTVAINFDKALGIHQQALSLRSERAAVLANNLANADTPGFKAKDLDFKSILQGEAFQMSSSVSMKHTHSGHIQGSAQFGSHEQLFRTPQQPSIDGNTVEEQVEHSEYMKNALAFQTSFTFLNKKFTGLMTAIKGE